MKSFQQLTQGNPGALSFIIELGSSDVPLRTMAKIDSSDIVGTDLYVLWSDLCKKDMKKVIHLVDNCPLDILKDACSRQDYSGKELVKEYMPAEVPA